MHHSLFLIKHDYHPMMPPLYSSHLITHLSCSPAYKHKHTDNHSHLYNHRYINHHSHTCIVHHQNRHTISRHHLVCIQDLHLNISWKEFIIWRGRLLTRSLGTLWWSLILHYLSLLCQRKWVVVIILIIVHTTKEFFIL